VRRARNARRTQLIFGPRERTITDL
jgi:hypothetical protein